jgi:septum site-determining protein MinC
MRVCRQHGLRTLAIRASRIEDIAAAIAIDLPVLPPSGARERPLDPGTGSQKKPEKPPEPTIKPTRIITTPVRGGQQIYAQGGDLVVISSVSPGRNFSPMATSMYTARCAAVPWPASKATPRRGFSVSN